MYWTTLGSTLGVGLKCLFSVYHLLQLHCWLWGCCSFACGELLLRKGIFWVAAEPRQGRHSVISVLAFPPKAALILPGPAAFTAQAVLIHHKVYLSGQSPFPRLLICKLQESEAGAALEFCIWAAPGVGELNQKKSWNAPHFIGNKTSFCWCSLFRITWLNCAKKTGVCWLRVFNKRVCKSLAPTNPFIYKGPKWKLGN